MWIQFRPGNVGPDLGPNCLQWFQQTAKVTADKGRAKECLHYYFNCCFKFQIHLECTVGVGVYTDSLAMVM